METMSLWQIWCIAGIVLCITEIFTPAMFLLNLGFACFVSAIFAALGVSSLIQVIVFAIFSAVFIIWLRPFLIRKRESDTPETVEMYIGKTAKVIEKVTQSGGRIAIFGEEWQAKSLDNEEYQIGEEVKIVKNDSIVMYVQKA